MIAVIDNYDSFTYNIIQEIKKLTDEPVRVFRSKECAVGDIDAVKPDKLIVSPGPGRPEDAGVSVDAIKYYCGKIPVLGVCLGHQAIGYAFGGNIVAAKHIRHGVVEEMKLDGKGLFRSIGKTGTFTRYHSLVIEERSIPRDFEITARAEDGDIMGIRHKEYPLEGIQFHPESIASKAGNALFAAFLNYRREGFPATEILNTLAERKDLSKETAELFMDDLTDGFQDQKQTAAILTAIAVKGPASSEIAGCAAALCKKKKNVPLKSGVKVTDIVGTGGDCKGSFNISSLSALAAAACGLPVAKHGNRAVSSKSGAADFYESLGIRIDAPPEKTADMIAKTNFGFLYAPVYHSAMRFAAPVRKALGIKTIMNLIGPLSNPAGAEYQMLGVYADDLLEPVAEAAKLLGAVRVMTVHSADGFDEISPCAPTHIVEIREDGKKRSYNITPFDFGITGCDAAHLAGGTGKENAETAEAFLNDPENPKYKTILEACCLNGGAALYIGGNVPSLFDGYKKIKAGFMEKTVADKLQEIRVESNG